MSPHVRFVGGVAVLFALAIGCGPEKPASAPAPASNQAGGTTSPDASQTAVPAEQPFQLEENFEPLTFADFEAFGAETDTWVASEEGLKCSGKPKGYLYTKQTFENFTWRLDYRFPRPDNLQDESKFKGNTGFLVYVTGEQKLWPVCLEVQGKHVQMAAIKENGGAEPVQADDNEPARQQARKPVGQWNSLEIVSQAGELTVSLNGTPISRCEPNFLSDGLLGIQAEDHPFEVRRMRVKRD